MRRSPPPLRLLIAACLIGAPQVVAMRPGLAAGPAASATSAPTATPTSTAAPPRAVATTAEAAPARPGPAPQADAEPAISATGPEGEYLRAMHSSIHFRWATKFVDWVAKKRPPTDALNNPSREVQLLFTVRWDGSPAQVTVSESSGVQEFDDAAVAAVMGEGTRFPVPPIDVYGDDGVAHFRWTFARDRRLCSGGEIRRFEAPLREALPRLFVQGRMKEALLRAARYTRTGDPNAMSEFARAYLARPFADPGTDVRAGAALARVGDARAIDRLRPALIRPDTMTIAAQGLAAAKVDMCPLVEASLKGSDPEAALFAARTLRASAVELPAESPCVAAMTAIVKGGGAAAVRAEMLDTLAAVNPNGVRRLALDALADPDARMRAAGVRAFARPRGGRPTLYRLQPLIGDPSLEVRAAVAAGLVRACGDLAGDYVQPLFKNREVQPLVAMAPELGKASSPASADLLAKLQKRPEADLRMPVLAALAARQDPAGRALYQPLADSVKKDPYAAPEARRIVYANADASELAPLTKDPVLGIFAFKAMLRAKRHSEAMDWLIGSFDRLSPETMVEALGAWLANPPVK